MSLEEEIAINQFGQGVHLHLELVEHFSRLNMEGRMDRLFELYLLVRQPEIPVSDVEQAINDSPLQATDTACVILKAHWLNHAFDHIIDLPDFPESELENAYTLLLYLFKVGYQRRFKGEKKHPSSWKYRDLSSPDVVQNILKNHRDLVEEVYMNPSLRSEFVSLAKLHQSHGTSTEASDQEPAPWSKKQFKSLSYDEVLSASVAWDVENNKYWRGIEKLRNSVEKVFSVQYRLDSEQVMRIIREVIDRYSQEK